MDPKKIAELEAATAAAKTAAEAAGGTDESLNQALQDAETALAQAKAPSQPDPVQQELERARKSGRTESEKAAFTLKKNADRARELGIDPAEVLGLSVKEKQEDDAPDESAVVTVGMLERMTKETARKTALQLADDITNENERELAKVYLATRIVPSGDPVADLRLAIGMVNSVKNSQILEEIGRGRGAKHHASGPGAPARPAAPDGELTAQEIPFTKAPWNMSKQDIIAKRPKAS